MWKISDARDSWATDTGRDLLASCWLSVSFSVFDRKSLFTDPNLYDPDPRSATSILHWLSTKTEKIHTKYIVWRKIHTNTIFYYVNKSRLFIDNEKKWCKKNLAATCRIEHGTPAFQSNALPLCQWDSWYPRFFSYIYQKWIVIPVGRLVIRPTVGRIVRLLADRLSVG